MVSISLSEQKGKEGREAREFASAVLTGTVIGRSLQDALQSLLQKDSERMEQDETLHQDVDSDDSMAAKKKPPIQEVTMTPLVKMKETCLEDILQSFQTSVAHTHTHMDASKQAPRALLKGKCDFYNRYGQNWMMALDRVKLKERPKTFRKRKRENRPSLWDRDADDKDHLDALQGKSQKEVDLKKKVQLLAYGDVA